MTRKNVWLAALATLAIGGATLLLNPFAGSDADLQSAGGTWADEPDPSHADGVLTATADDTRVARTQIAGAVQENTEEEEEDTPRPSLTVSGRVVSDAGSPVPGARVAVSYRLSFDGARGRDLGFGGGGADRGRAFRPRPIAQAVLTDTEGRFTLNGRAFATSTLDVVVAHKEFAPATLQRDWQRRDGVIQLGDIVVGAGALVSGFVVDILGKGIAKAEVRFQLNGQGGPGQFGGRGGRGQRGGRGGNEEETGIENLVAAAETDSTGFFRIDHVPEGRFRLQARATRYLPAVSDALQAKSATAVDAGQLKLILGVELRGVVVDPSGAPIADARIEAGASRRDGEGRGGNNRGGNGNGSPGAVSGLGTNGNGNATEQPDWQAMAAAWRAGANDRRTRTDKRGEFVLDSLPPGALRLRVEHPRFVTEERQGIDPQKEPRVVVRLDPALTLIGKVIDGGTSKPITVYAIAARENDWGNRGGPGNDNQGGRGRRGGGEDNPQGGRRRGGNADGNAGDNGNDELAAQRAADEARRAQRTAYLQDRLGPTGQPPRNPGRAGKHEDGRFELPGLQPGRYLLDVMADNYIGLAFGPIELVKGQTPAELTIGLRLGSQIKGTVTDKLTNTPLAGVQVELMLPDLEASTQATEQPFQMFRREAGRVRVARTRTDAKGHFVLRPQRSGDYWLSFDHDGYNTLLDRAVFVPDGRVLETPPYALVPGSEIFGRVLNAIPDKQYTLTFWSTTGPRFTARADKELRYHVEGIEAGSYYVLLSDGESRGDNGGQRGRGGPGGFGGAGARLADMARGNTRPDVVIGEGAKVQFDVDARSQAPAKVHGKVLLNGNPAAGYDVSLSTRDDPSASADGNGDAGFMGRMMGRLLSDRTDEQGEFAINNVPAGSYTLEVRPGGGGGGGGRGGRGRGGFGGATMHREPIVVAQGATMQRTLTFAIGSLAFEVSQEPDGKPLERGAISLALRSEAAAMPFDQWRSLPSYTNVPIRAGAASLRELKLGEWVYRLQSQVQPAVEGAVFVAATSTPMPVKVKVKTAPPAKPTQPAGQPTAK